MEGEEEEEKKSNVGLIVGVVVGVIAVVIIVGFVVYKFCLKKKGETRVNEGDSDINLQDMRNKQTVGVAHDNTGLANFKANYA